MTASIENNLKPDLLLNLGSPCASAFSAECLETLDVLLLIVDECKNAEKNRIKLHAYKMILNMFCLYSSCLKYLLLSYEKVKHIVEVDEKILAVFIVDSNGNTSDVFIAPDSKIDRSFIETLRSNLDLKFKVTTVEKQEKLSSNVPGKHLWDISEYDKIRVITIYESNHW